MAEITKGMRVTTTQTRCNLEPEDVVPRGELTVERGDSLGTVYLVSHPGEVGGWQVNTRSCTPVPTLIKDGMWVTTTQKRCNMAPSDVLPSGPIEVVRGQYADATPGTHGRSTIMVGGSKKYYNVDVSSCTVVPGPSTVTYIGEAQNLPPLPTFDLKKAGQRYTPPVVPELSTNRLRPPGEKHGPGQQGGRGDCDPDCLKCANQAKAKEPKKGWTFKVPLDEVDGMRILRELDEAGAKYASLDQGNGRVVVIVHDDILKELPDLKVDTFGGPMTKVDKNLYTYDQKHFGPATRWFYVGRGGPHNTLEKLKAAIEGARKAKREASKVRVTVEYGT